MRTLLKNNSDLKINVTKHIILRNMWEYYITDYKHGAPGIFEALVMGHDTELGDVDYNEIKPYIISETSNLNIMPCDGYSWAN